MKQPNPLYLLFKKSASLYPDKVAVSLGSTSLTYKELDREIADVHKLIIENASNERVLGVSTTRCIELIVYLLAILKAGKAYLPIDFKYPKTRIQSIIDNSGVNFCLTIKEEDSKVHEFGLKTIFSNNQSIKNLKVQPEMTENATYILYTSGSTGTPKGVCMGTNALLNLINWQSKASNADEKTNTLQFAPLSFDVSFQEIFSTFSTGGTLVLIDEEHRLDMVALLKLIEQQQINRLFLPFVALQALAETAVSIQIFPQSVNEIMTAGEQLKITPQVRQFFKSLNNCRLYNQYGPTECHVVSELKLEGNPDNWPALPNIGKPIDNTSIYILNKQNTIVPDGEIGELCITGDCLAEGYLGNEQLTKEKFSTLQLLNSQNVKMYRTGDMARYLENGYIDFLGREDEQVKISGHRIELGEVEIALNKLPNIKQAVVIATKHLSDQAQLIAYLQTNNSVKEIPNFSEQVKSVLPDYMLPAYYIWIEDFPRTTSGKIDKKALPAPEYKRPDTAPIFKKPTTETQKNIANTWSEILKIPKIGILDNFFEMGGTSLLAQKTVAVLKQHYDYNIPIIKLYQYPSISELSNYLEPKKESTSLNPTAQNNESASSNIAVIGMSGRFPGADSIEDLWQILKDGRETISFFSQDQLDVSISESLRKDKLYVAARGIVPSAKEFDATFFGINPKLAEAMDPQQRLFLEIAWEVLEQTGYLPAHFKGTVGVYAGTGMNSYFKNNILPNKNILNSLGSFLVDTVNEKDYVATRTAYELNLNGPAVSVHSGCSTSLLAVAEAVNALRSGQCDVAIAGGASVTSPIYSGHLYQEGSMLSPDGHCRPFDANARGTVFSDGAGAVLLKRLDQAEKDGDIIYAVIKGVGVTNDGRNKGSFTAPSTEGQASAISRAIFDAKIDPSEITYIEAHGTATPVGDPIEIEGLKMAFGSQSNNNYCAIGSIKSNMGHLTGAAGVAGLIKTVLALKNQQIPATLGYETPNPSIDFENSPFYVNNKLASWNYNGLRKAGISSFGVGGTNVHVILEEHQQKEVVGDKGRPLQIITCSAKTKNSLKEYQNKLSKFLDKSPNIQLADIAYSLSLTREQFAERSFLITESFAEASKVLNEQDNSLIKTGTLQTAPNELAFLFPGQGSQYLQMGQALYKNEPVFKSAVDTCALILESDLKLDIRTIIYPEDNTLEAENKLKDTQFTQPALFVIEYALSQLWFSWGIKPSLLCGHSIGEFVAAHLAGIFSLEDALHLIAVRGKLVSELPEGSMLSISSNLEELKVAIPDNLSIAAINSDRLMVASGENNAIENFQRDLDKVGIPNKLLLTSHAFHSNMMDPVLNVFETEVSKIQMNIPRLPVVSTVTGDWLTDQEATSASYWANHLRATVNFSGAMETVLKLDEPVLLEVGPGRALTTLSMQKKGLKSLASVASLTKPNENENAYHTILSALGTLWLNGVNPDWHAFYKDQSRQKIMLPAYAFDRKPCWIDPIINNPDNLSEPTHFSVQTEIESTEHTTNNTIFMRKPILLDKIAQIVEDNSGVEIGTNDYNLSFLELGLDSLVLTQMAINLKNEFNTPITFRQLNGELGSPDLLADYIDKLLPQDMYAPEKAATVNQTAPTAQATNNLFQPINVSSNANQNPALSLIAQQIQLLGKQIELLQGNSNGAMAVSENIQPLVTKPPIFTPNNLNSNDDLSEEEKKEHQKPFGASPRIEKQAAGLTKEINAFLEQLVVSYNKKTAGSKAYTQKHRGHMSDPRVVSGFKPETKELVYPIVVERSSGNRLWDIDGNEYIDVLNGFGSSLFGHQPEFIKQTIHEQVELGFEVGPQHPLAGEVCELLCEFTGQERAALCNTGSEAVLGAMRIARTVTGRSLIVAFSRSYHGINDEVIVRGSKKLKSFPAASGILPEAVKNMLILDYGTDESLAIIKERAHEIAAVLVEPVQSRRPEFRPIEFLKEVREITKASDTVLIFDEIITGFRMHPGGAQALFGIKADLATYGKVIGGGLSIGAIVGSKKCMDALDGGYWQYGDDSFPEAGVTYFAGTFVRHPLALATAKASLLHMKKHGAQLQEEVSLKTEYFASEINSFLKSKQLPLEIAYYRSLWRLKMLEDVPYAELFFVLMREKGIHVWDGFPCYMTTVFTESDLKQLIATFKECIEILINVGIFHVDTKISISETTINKSNKELNQPPVPGARLGIDQLGNPAWFVADKDKVGEYVQIDL
jgi:amino acid adenylation domain-containing protein